MALRSSPSTVVQTPFTPAQAAEALRLCRQFSDAAKGQPTDVVLAATYFLIYFIEENDPAKHSLDDAAAFMSRASALLAPILHPTP